MRLIEHVAIRNFRSLRRVAFQDLDDYVPIIGLNGSGKSNVLRILSLFFGGVLDESNTTLDLARDFPDFVKTKEKRQISVAVTFDLSHGYAVRGTKDVIEGEAKNDRIVIERSWSYVPGSTDIQDTLRYGADVAQLRQPDVHEITALQTFIRSVQFRYIPNHARPADLIQNEIQPLRRTLVSRLKQTNEYRGVDETMDAMDRVASVLFEPLSRSIRRGTLELSAIAASLPKDFADLAFQVALNAVSQTGSVQSPELQGSGTQSFMLLHVLALIDTTSRERGFGWRQSSIWAVEEPESFLHAGLRSRFADDLWQLAQDSRRQIFITTHQDEFVRKGEHAWMATMREGATLCTKLSSREALTQSSKLRITNFNHPLMTSPDDPLVLVEGKFDLLYLRKGLIEAGIRPRWKLSAMAELDPEHSGGSAIVPYLKANSQVLRSRSETAPVIVLRDWEDEGKIGAFTSALTPHTRSCAIACPPDMVNPELDQSFRGIERFLPTEFIEKAAADRVKPHSLKKQYPLAVATKEYETIKQVLASEFSKYGLAGSHLVALARWLDKRVEMVLGAVPADLFLPDPPLP